MSINSIKGWSFMSIMAERRAALKLDLSRSVLWGVFSLLLIVPLCLSGSCSIHSTSLTTPAYASLDSHDMPVLLNDMTDLERTQYARNLTLLVSDSPKYFHHLMDQELRLMFSDPAMVRRDGTNFVWQYKSDVCVVDLYFSGNESSNVVSYYEIRQNRKANFARALSNDSAPDVVNNAACVQSLADQG